MATFSDPAVKAVFDGYSPAMRKRLLALRALIFAAAKQAKVGALVETLRWGQPSYLPAIPRTGTTVRIDSLRGRDDAYALFVPCSTTLIASFREHYGSSLRYDGKRAVVFTLGSQVPAQALKHCIAMALTYHARKGG